MNKYNFKKISKFKQVLEPAEKQRIPIVFHVSNELMPDDATIEQLIEVASDLNVTEHIAALTDVSAKPGRRNAAGTVVATKNHYIPQLLE